MGSSRGLERRIVPAAGVHAYFVPMAPPTSLRNVLMLTLATVRAVLLVARLRPRSTFATGGYACVPAAVASWLLRVPLVLFLPDVVPGKAVAWLVPLARRVAASSGAALAHLPADKTVVTGYPVREEFLGLNQEQARQRLGLPAHEPVLVVFGGSQGARSINEALMRWLPDLLQHCIVVHVTGRDRWDEVGRATASLSAGQRVRYRAFPYLDAEDMAAALAAADLAVCRSGASVLGELPVTATPAVLVPLPDPRVHQRDNADYLQERGAAAVLANDDLQDRLGPAVLEILDDPSRLATMTRCCRALARPDAAACIATLVEEVA